MTIHWCRPNDPIGDIADPPRRPTDPLPPEVLADAHQDRIHPTSGRLLASKRIAPYPVVCPQCGNSTTAPSHAGWQWCALRDAWYCPRCGRPQLSEQEYERYVCGLRAGYGDALGGYVGPEILSSDPWFLRGMKRGRASAGKDKPERGSSRVVADIPGIRGIHLETLDDGTVFATHPDLPAHGYGATRAEAIEAFREMLAHQRAELVDCDESELTPGGVRARKQILAHDLPEPEHFDVDLADAIDVAIGADKPRLVRNEDLPDPPEMTDEIRERLCAKSKAWREEFNATFKTMRGIRYPTGGR